MCDSCYRISLLYSPSAYQLPIDFAIFLQGRRLICGRSINHTSVGQRRHSANSLIDWGCLSISFGEQLFWRESIQVVQYKPYRVRRFVEYTLAEKRTHLIFERRPWPGLYRKPAIHSGSSASMPTLNSYSPPLCFFNRHIYLFTQGAVPGYGSIQCGPMDFSSIPPMH